MTNTLAARIAKASIDIGGSLKADKRHEQQKYDYISADKIIDRAGQVLAENGVVLIPAITSTTVDTYQTGGGKSFYSVAVNFAMTLTDGETSLEYPWMGMGTDYSVVDKALYKAITSGHKYFLVKLLNIGAGNEDGEHEAPPADVQVNDSARRTNYAPRPNGGATRTPTMLAREQPNNTRNDSIEPAGEHGTGTDDNPFTADEAAALRKLHAIGTALYAAEWDVKRHEIVSAVSKGRTQSSKQLTLAELTVLIEGLEKRQRQAVPA